MSHSSASVRGQNILTIKELHLTPHFIYMISDTQPLSQNCYSVVMEKDGVKIGQTHDITYIGPTDLIKYPALQFGTVRFVFNVKALFEEQAAVKIQLKLLIGEDSQDMQVRQQFEINLLHYSYQHSRERVVKHKQNSTGKLKKYILNYSFSAIYGKAFDEKILFNQLKESIKEEKDERSKISENNQFDFNIVVKEPLALKENNTLVLVEAVAAEGIDALGIPDKWEETVSDRSYFASSESRKTELINNRRVLRSILVVDDMMDQPFLSSLTEPEIEEQLKKQGSQFGSWGLLLISIVLIYLLMHPSSKV